MGNSELQFIGILVAVTGLLGWTVKQAFSFFISNANEKNSYIEKLVSTNQTNTENFINTINHQRTLDREMQGRHLKMLEELKQEISNSNKVSEKMFAYLKRP